MKPNDNKHRKIIQATAADWVACVYSGHASQADEDRLEQWLNESPEHGAEYFKALEVWDAVGETTIEEDSNTLGKGDTQNWLKAITAIAAVLLVTIISYSVFQTAFTNTDVETIQSFTTTKGETREITLADGSTATLNTDSRLFVDFNDEIRRTILDSGEVFFDVKKNVDRPFVVTVGNQSVTVLGTKFNIQREGAQVTVAVVEGLVAVHENLEPEKLKENARMLVTTPQDESLSKLQHVRLEAGSVGVFHKSNDLMSYIASTDAESYQDWRQGILRFSDQSLETVIVELSRYTDQKITLSSSEVSQLKISGVFHYQDIEGIMTGLEAMLPITVTRKNNEIIIHKLAEN